MIKALKRLLISIILTCLIVAAILLGAYYFILTQYGIDVFSTVGDLKTLSQSVDENAICSEVFSDEDMADGQIEVNKSVESFISYTEEYGYVVSFDNLPKEMKYDINLTEKQACAITQALLEQKANGKIDVGGNELGLELKQMDFSEITRASVLFSTVIRLDITSVKNSPSAFPYNILKSGMPNYFYISSSVSVTHDSQPFVYSVAHNDISINNLSAEQTEKLFGTLDIFMKIGSAQSFNERIGNMLLEILVGNETQTGIAYSLKEIGAEGYTFRADGNGEYFVVLRNEEFTPSDGSEGHAHDVEHIKSEQKSCTGNGNAEYWHCKSCDKYFADENGTDEIKNVTITASGHISVSKSDEKNHWYECEICSVVLSDAEPHTASGYEKDRLGHRKVCSDCGAVFAEGEHSGDPCSICGYSVDYAEICASGYGYKYLGTLSDGVKFQAFYNKIDKTASAFHDDATKNAKTESSSSGKTYYVAGEINFSSLGLTVNQAVSVWVTYRADHPLYYWLAGNIVYSSEYLSLCVDEAYKDGSARKAQNNKLYEAIAEYLNFALAETSDYQIAFALHDKIIDDIEYAYDEQGQPSDENWAHNIIGAFINGKAVCEGYAKSFSLLLNACGVENAYVSGTSNIGEGHAWNTAKIDGNWYWYDLTWDDQPHIGDGIVYDYFCVPGETFDKHVVAETENMQKPISFLYRLPDMATSKYDTEAIEYGESFTSGGFTYTVCGYNEVALISATTATDCVTLTNVTHGGRTYSLSEIGKAAFENNQSITALVIPASVEVIYNFAFYKCTELTQITFTDKTGWYRTSKNGTFEVLPASIESPIAAATLLKEMYISGEEMYQYTWRKSRLDSN